MYCASRQSSDVRTRCRGDVLSMFSSTMLGQYGGRDANAARAAARRCAGAAREGEAKGYRAGRHANAAGGSVASSRPPRSFQPRCSSCSQSAAVPSKCVSHGAAQVMLRRSAEAAKDAMPT